MTVLKLLWMRFEVAAIIDGYSRKILGLRVFRGSPTTNEVVRLVDEAITGAFAPRYLVTDRGGQFQRAFRNRMRARGVEHARGPAGAWPFNAKVERLFWNFKRWWCPVRSRSSDDSTHIPLGIMSTDPMRRWGA